MIYLLIENNEPEQGATVTICRTAIERNQATVKAIFGDDFNRHETECLASLKVLEDTGELDFEGDPGLRWINACEVKFFGMEKIPLR